MVPDATALIRIDLNQFKLHLTINQKIEVSLHFDSPSRKFYLSVIALVVYEMKRSGRVTAIPLEAHHPELALLNETVGGGAGSSSKQNLIPRIYKKWKSALPDLENAPLFRIPGRKKQYGEGIEKTYQFGDEEKDCWANLFDYHGSGENVRLQFSLSQVRRSPHFGIYICAPFPRWGLHHWRKWLFRYQKSHRKKIQTRFLESLFLNYYIYDTYLSKP